MWPWHWPSCHVWWLCQHRSCHVQPNLRRPWMFQTNNDLLIWTTLRYGNHIHEESRTHSPRPWNSQTWTKSTTQYKMHSSSITKECKDNWKIPTCITLYSNLKYMYMNHKNLKVITECNWYTGVIITELIKHSDILEEKNWIHVVVENNVNYQPTQSKVICDNINIRRELLEWKGKDRSVYFQRAIYTSKSSQASGHERGAD